MLRNTSSLRFTPESTRWLIAQGKIEKAMETIEEIARKNKRPFPDLKELQSIIENEENEKKNNKLQYNYFTLFKFKATRWRVPLFGFLW